MLSIDKLRNKIEAVIARKIVDYALKQGWYVSVYDGGEWALKRSIKREEILDALASTDEDTLRFSDALNKTVGRMWLIYGNGEDLISDYSDNSAMNTLAEMVESEYRSEP